MAKTAIVTGASRGIGYEISSALAEEGHQVWAVARSKEPLEILQREYPGHIRALPTDLKSGKELDRLIKEISKDGQSVNILVNNAGALINKPFNELDKEDWQHMLDINLIAAVDLVKRLLPHFTEESHIVNISSMGGFQGSVKFPGLAAYSVAKGALSILSECLAIELRERKIYSNALCLGAVQTEMLEQAFPGFEAPVNAEDMGAYIADFALEGSNFYNGQVLPVALSNPE